MSAIELARLEDIPVYQNKVFADAAAARACPRGDLVLAQDPDSGFVRNIAYDRALLAYDDSYQNEQGNSAVFRAHIDDVLAIIGRQFDSRRILEVGCGKGRFLEAMLAAGHDAFGVDPAYEGDSDRVIRSEFGPSLGVRGEAIVMRHVLEHVPAPAAFLQRIRDANAGGLIYIEVPCFDWIMRHRAWFDLFYEHVNYFREDDFARLFGTILEAGHLFGGQYLYVVAALDSLRDPAVVPTPPRIAKLPADFFASLDRCAGLARDGRPCAVWGAAAKGVMFTHHLLARGVRPLLAIDINPAKQQSFMAGSGVAVYAPSDAMAQLGPHPRIFVMNSNYLEEIRAVGGTDPDYIAVDQA
ncbi:MAG: class I SAM-dependent methyltransferase [Dokdonella sp.]|uniref:class I SAM-dependent methyltransferase n=1 Tax=Dokdonella sp. TaxID=2291710 RepID=UPI003F7E50CF